MRVAQVGAATMKRNNACQRLWADRRGEAAIGYVVVVAFAIAMALATLTLRLPIKKAEEAALSCLADNNP